MNEIEKKVLLDFVNSIEAFIINIDLLDEINSNLMKNNEYNYEYILNNTNNHLIFGVHENFITELSPVS